jgi:hypothetical protein
MRSPDYSVVTNGRTYWSERWSRRSDRATAPTGRALVGVRSFFRGNVIYSRPRYGSLHWDGAPLVGAILPDGTVFDSFGRRLTQSREPSDAGAADWVIGSCSFLLCAYGVRIQWGEKDHNEVVKLVQAKMKAGVRFFIIDPALLRLAPVKRANRAMGREVYVRDPDIKKLLEGGFVRFATSSFEGIGQIKTLGTAKSAEEAARADTIAVPPTQPAENLLIGANAIADFLSHELKLRPNVNTVFTPRTVYNWAGLKKLPVRKLPNSTTLVASTSALRQWFEDIGRGIVPTLRGDSTRGTAERLCSRGYVRRR